MAGASHTQDCCLCLLRGGALKPTDGGRWAHLVCAINIPDVHLGDVCYKEPIITEQITRARRKLVSVAREQHLFSSPCYYEVSAYSACVTFAAILSCRDVPFVKPSHLECLHEDMVYVCSVLLLLVAQQCMSHVPSTKDLAFNYLRQALLVVSTAPSIWYASAAIITGMIMLVLYIVIYNIGCCL